MRDGNRRNKEARGGSRNRRNNRIMQSEVNKGANNRGRQRKKESRNIMIAIKRHEKAVN